MKRGVNPVGLHVMNYEGKLGTVSAVINERVLKGVYSPCLDVHHFNGESWDYRPVPGLVYVIE